MNIATRFAGAWLAGACASVVAGACLAQTAYAAAPATAPSAVPEGWEHGPHHGTPYSLDHGAYDLNAPTSTEEELNEILEPHTGMFTLPFINDPVNSVFDAQRQLAESTGLRVAFAYTQLYQQASGGPGDRWAMSGDADLLFDWTLVGRGTENPGRFVFSVEERFTIGSAIPPSQLRGQIGSLVGTTGGFNDQGLVIRDAFWDQWLADGRLRVLIGRAAPGDYVGAHRLQNSNNAYFNTNFSGNVTMAAPGHGPMAVLSVKPNDLFYVTAGAANAYSVTTKSSLNTLFDEGKLYTFGEVGVTPEIEELGRGRIAVTGWYMPERELLGLPSDWGVNLTAEQYISENLWVFGRYGYADTGLTGVKQGCSAGVAFDGLLGSPDNLTALAVGYAVPTNNGLRDETSAEVFHRFQVTEHTQFTVGAQAIIDPANAPNDDVIGVFSFRLRFEF